MSLTSTFDRKLKFLNQNVEINTAEVEEPTLVVTAMTKKRNGPNDRAVEDNSSFRDPSLHKTLERTSRVIENQVRLRG